MLLLVKDEFSSYERQMKCSQGWFDLRKFIILSFINSKMIHPPRLSLPHSARGSYNKASFRFDSTSQRQLHPKSTHTARWTNSYCVFICTASACVIASPILSHRVDGCFYLSVFTSKLTLLSSFRRQWRSLNNGVCTAEERMRESERHHNGSCAKSIIFQWHTQPVETPSTERPNRKSKVRNNRRAFQCLFASPLRRK